MKLPGFYSSGEFAKLAGVSVRTIRFYDQKNILKPSYVNDTGARFYTEEDLAKLQQILLFKYLGFSLEDIKELAIDDTDSHYLINALNLQKKLVQDKIEQMQIVENAIEDTVSEIEKEHQLDWSNMLDLIHLTGMEKSLKSQYQNASNISARIRLHRDYSINKQGWFPWLFDICRMENGMRILEVGCGNGEFWLENIDKIPEKGYICLSDISDGMVRDAKRNISLMTEREIDFQVIDCEEIPFENGSFDMVIANHVLFYMDDIEKACREIKRVLKTDGTFVCSTYGKGHMKEITEFVQEFDSRIVLSAESLYEKFGLENGADILNKVFENVECRFYEDEIILNRAEPLVEYILSCHGNQNQLLLDRYKEFKNYADKKVKKEYHITKEAGVFVCK